MPNPKASRTPVDSSADSEPPRLGDRLIEAGLITRSELDSTLDWLRENGLSKRRLGRTLVELGFLSDRELTKILGMHFGMPIAPFPVLDAEQAAIKEVPAEFARRHRLVPCRLFSGSVFVAAPGPVAPDVVSELATMSRHSVWVYLASEREIEAGLAKFYPERSPDGAKEGSASAEEPTTSATAGPGAGSTTSEPASRAGDATPTPADKPTSAKIMPMSETVKVQGAATPSNLRERAQRYAAQTHEMAAALQRIIEDNERLTVDAGQLEQECETLRQDNARLLQDVDRAHDDTARLRQEVERLRQEKEQVLGAVAKLAQETLARHQPTS
jgi:hypothetical protein